MHPVHLIGEEAVLMTEWWLSWRGAEGVPGRLPFGGGDAEQPALVIACFHEMESVAAMLQRRGG